MGNPVLKLILEPEFKACDFSRNMWKMTWLQVWSISYNEVQCSKIIKPFALCFIGDSDKYLESYYLLVVS